jgi:hypothetical protein
MSADMPDAAREIVALILHTLIGGDGAVASRTGAPDGIA